MKLWTIRERIWFNWMDLKTALYELRTVYYNVKIRRAERKIKELEFQLLAEKSEY